MRVETSNNVDNKRHYCIMTYTFYYSYAMDEWTIKPSILPYVILYGWRLDVLLTIPIYSSWKTVRWVYNVTHITYKEHKLGMNIPISV